MSHSSKEPEHYGKDDYVNLLLQDRDGIILGFEIIWEMHSWSTYEVSAPHYMEGIK